MKDDRPKRSSSPSARMLVRVDADGRTVGTEEKEKCHAGDGVRHSAFLVMLFDEDGRLMGAQRSPAKKLWPGYWDGTVASHFYPGETRASTIRQRVLEEIGVTCGPLEYLFRFSYESRYRDIGIEKEVCRVYKAGRIRSRDVLPNRAEVAQFRFSRLPDLRQEVEKYEEAFTPWFLLAFRRFLREAR